MRAAAVALASVVVMGGSVGVRGWSASAEPGLLPPVVVGEPAPRGLHLSEVAVGGDGTATLGWLMGTRSRRVQVATRAPGAAAFGPVHTLDPGGRWGPYAPSVAAAADGTAVAAWVAIAGDYDRAAVWAAIRPAGGTSFDPARRLTGVGRFPGLPRVALNDAGRAVVAWSGRRGVRAAVLAPGSRAFSTPQGLRSLLRDLAEPSYLDNFLGADVEINERGDALVVWAGIDKHYRYVVQSASLTAASAVFGATGRVVRVPGELWTFGAELDDVGNATVVWNASDFVQDDVAMVLRPVGGAFGQPVTLTPGRRQGVWPVIDSDGDSVAVVFSEWARREPGGLRVVSWSGAPPIAGLASTSLAGSRGTPEHTIAVGPGGRTVVVWAGVGNAGPYLRSAYRATAGAPFVRLPDVVDMENPFVDGVAADFDDQGNATVGWREHGERDVIRSTVLGTAG